LSLTGHFQPGLIFAGNPVTYPIAAPVGHSKCWLLCPVLQTYFDRK
jgi:hypothetical protein